MLDEPLALALAGLVGCLLGVVFFGGLWWTVRKGLAAKRSALWFLGSLLLRMVVVLAGFYWVGRAHWQRLLLCLAGFVMARLIVTWLTRPTPANPLHPAQEVSHAPQS